MTTTTFDIAKLTREQKVKLIQDIFTSDPTLKTELMDQSNKVNEELDQEYIDQLIDKHFEEYDEVFRKLA